MTCEEVRKYIEDNARSADPEVWSDSPVSAHVAICSACGQFVRERQSLRRNLQLVRESVGSVPDSLDAAVLSSYRRFIAGREEAPRVSVGKPYFPMIVRWGVVCVLALTVAATALFVHRKPTKAIVAPSPVRPSTTTIPAVLAPTPTAPPQIRAAKRSVPRMQRRGRSLEAHSVVRDIAPIPDDFRGLMYCDELSCGGAMEMIRVQLPSSMIARPNLAFRRASGPVNADVLIGPDGIARGIRIEGREF